MHKDIGYAQGKTVRVADGRFGEDLSLGDRWLPSATMRGLVISAFFVFFNWRRIKNSVAVCTMSPGKANGMIHGDE